MILITNPSAYSSRIEAVATVDKLVRAAMSATPDLSPRFNWAPLILQLCGIVAATRKLSPPEATFLFRFYDLPAPTDPVESVTCRKCGEPV